MIRKIQAIIFDFDGVVLDSNKIKKEAYFKIFSDIQNSRDSIEEVIRENPEKNRYGIIEFVLKKFKERNLMKFDELEAERDRYVQRYGEITERETIKAKEIPGAEKALTTLSQRYPLFILTSTIQKSIDKIVDARDLRKYFKAIYGAIGNNYNKPKILEKMAEIYRFNPKNSVFVGDGKADYECAKQSEMIFIGVINETNDFEKREDITWKLHDLENLPEMVGEINSTNFS